MQKIKLKTLFKVMVWSCLVVAVCIALFFLSLIGWFKWNCHLPDEQTVRNQFQQHRADFVRMVDLLDHDKTIHIVENDGSYEYLAKTGFFVDDARGPASSEYNRILKTIGAQSVLVREDRSVEFTMWGCGAAIMSDHFMGVRYVPKDYLLEPTAGWQQTVVASVDTRKLPQENGEVASGLYVVPVEPEWYVYRFEYQE